MCRENPSKELMSDCWRPGETRMRSGSTRFIIPDHRDGSELMLSRMTLADIVQSAKIERSTSELLWDNMTTFGRDMVANVGCNS